jgi:anti-anti-sigma factor
MTPLATSTRGDVGLIELTEASVGHASLRASGPAIELAFAELGERDVVLDFGRVKTLSSEAIGYILAIHRRQEARGKRLALANVSPPLASILDTLNLLHILRVAPTLEEALAMMERHPRLSG